MWSSACTAPSLRKRRHEQTLTDHQRKWAQVEILEREQVEREKRRCQFDRRATDVERRRQPPALLQPRKARLPLRVHDDDFPVDDAGIKWQRLDRARDFWKDRRVVVAVSREQQRLAVRFAGDESIAVELELEQPAVTRERRVGRLGEHDVDGVHVDVMTRCASLLDGCANAAA
jgi:hypothetical protein